MNSKMLMVFVDENDSFGTTPLYEAVIRRLRQLGVAGATAQSGLMGFGKHLTIHHKGLFGVSDDRPVTILAVDSESKLREAAPQIRAMVTEGLVLLVDVEVIPRDTSA